MARKRPVKKPANTPANKSTPAQSARVGSSYMSYKDVQIAFLMDGVAGLDNMVARGTSRASLRTALDKLRKQGRSVESFAQWFDDKYGATFGRGRNQPQSGDTRQYKAQQIHTGEPFIRLPLGVLGATKGELISVRFDKGLIRVEKPANAR